MFDVGDQAPGFELEDQNGETVSLSGRFEHLRRPSRFDILPALKGEDSHVGILRFADYPVLWGHVSR